MQTETYHLKVSVPVSYLLFAILFILYLLPILSATELCFVTKSLVVIKKNIVM